MIIATHPYPFDEITLATQNLPRLMALFIDTQCYPCHSPRTPFPVDHDRGPFFDVLLNWLKADTSLRDEQGAF